MIGKQGGKKSEMVGNAHGWSVIGRVTKIVGDNLVLVDIILDRGGNYPKGSSLAIQYNGYSFRDPILEEALTGYEPIEVKKNDVVSAYYFTEEKRDVAGIKGCGYIKSYGSLHVTPEEEYDEDSYFGEAN